MTEFNYDVILVDPNKPDQIVDSVLRNALFVDSLVKFMNNFPGNDGKKCLLCEKSINKLEDVACALFIIPTNEAQDKGARLISFSSALCANCYKGEDEVLMSKAFRAFKEMGLSSLQKVKKL
jgi:hypothetical protein